MWDKIKQVQLTILSVMGFTAFVAITVAWLTADKVSTELYIPVATALIFAAAGLKRQ